MNAQCLQQLWPKTKYLHFGHKILSKRLILERMKGQVKKMLCHINYSFIGHRSDKYLALPLSSLACCWEAFKKAFLRISSAKVGGSGTCKSRFQKRENFFCQKIDETPHLLYFVYPKKLYTHTVPLYMCRILLQKQ